MHMANIGYEIKEGTLQKMSPIKSSMEIRFTNSSGDVTDWQYYEVMAIPNDDETPSDDMQELLQRAAEQNDTDNS